MKKVLIIDDEKDMIELISSNLAKKGYETSCALSGREGLDLARSEKPDIITLDLIMPDMDGIQVMEKLKEDEELKDIPVILLSIVSESYCRLPVIKKETIYFIEKPINFEQLDEIIRKACLKKDINP